MLELLLYFLFSKKTKDRDKKLGVTCWKVHTCAACGSEYHRQMHQLPILAIGAAAHPRPFAPGGVASLESRSSRLPGLAGFVGLLALLSAPVLVIALAWPLNDAWYPPVAGPGDSTYIYFAEKIESVQGHWRGTPEAQITNAAELGRKGAYLKVDSRNDTWPDTIHAKSGEERSRSHPWVRVYIPDDASLTGQTLSLLLKVDVVYPAAARSGDHFDVRQATFQLRAQLSVGPARAGTVYLVASLVGGILGMVLICVAGVLYFRAARAMAMQALPSHIEPLESPSPPLALPADETDPGPAAGD